MVSHAFSIPLGDADLAAGRGARRRAYLLDAFIGGAENLLAREAVLGFPRQLPEPRLLLLVGPTGSGKSLLTRALAGRWKEDRSNRDRGNRERGNRERGNVSVRVTNGADFARDWATACRTDGVQDLRDRYTHCGLLIIDNVEQLAGKPAAQHELTLVLDALFRGNIPVVAASQFPPGRKHFAARLASRLSAGWCVPVNIPAAAARRRIIAQLAEIHEIAMHPDAVDCLAEGLAASVPQINGAILQLAAPQLHDGAKGDVTTSQAVQYLKSLTGDAQTTLQLVARLVARHFRVKLADLRGPSRRQALAAARCVAMVLVRQHTNLSLQQIGQYFSGRDHTTVLYSCRKAKKLLATNTDIQQAVQHITQQLDEQQCSSAGHELQMGNTCP